MVYEFYRLAPEGVLFLNTTGTVRALRDRDLETQLQALEAAARDVAPERPDLIVAGGSPLVTMQGYGSEERIAARLTAACGIPCVTGIQLEVEALRAVGSRRPVIASPYPPELDERLVRYLGQAGFEVQGCKGLGIVDNAEIGLLPVHAALRAGREAAAMAPRADAIFLPCGRWPTLDAVVQLEQDLGLPVVSSAVAIFHGALLRLGVRHPFDAWGSLLRRLSPREVLAGSLVEPARRNTPDTPDTPDGYPRRAAANGDAASAADGEPAAAGVRLRRQAERSG
jgi:maleate cis-trans isomerase